MHTRKDKSAGPEEQHARESNQLCLLEHLFLPWLDLMPILHSTDQKRCQIYVLSSKIWFHIGRTTPSSRCSDTCKQSSLTAGRSNGTANFWYSYRNWNQLSVVNIANKKAWHRSSWTTALTATWYVRQPLEHRLHEEAMYGRSPIELVQRLASLQDRSGK